MHLLKANQLCTASGRVLAVALSILFVFVGTGCVAQETASPPAKPDSASFDTIFRELKADMPVGQDEILRGRIEEVGSVADLELSDEQLREVVELIGALHTLNRRLGDGSISDDEAKPVFNELEARLRALTGKNSLEILGFE